MSSSGSFVSGAIDSWSADADASSSLVSSNTDCTVARISLDRMIRDLVPFVLVILACLMVISYVPALSLTLRDLVYAR